MDEHLLARMERQRDEAVHRFKTADGSRVCVEAERDRLEMEVRALQQRVHDLESLSWADSVQEETAWRERTEVAELALSKSQEELAYFQRELSESRGEEETSQTLAIYESFKEALEPFGQRHLNVRARIENLVEEWKAASISAGECSIAEMNERSAREKAEKERDEALNNSCPGAANYGSVCLAQTEQEKAEKERDEWKSKAFEIEAAQADECENCEFGKVHRDCGELREEVKALRKMLMYAKMNCHATALKEE